MNTGDIASAIATRYSGITAPSGYDAIATSTHLLPGAISTTPTVLVFPPTSTIHYEPGALMTSEVLFPVRCYFAEKSGPEQEAAILHAWYGLLLARLVGQFTLGLSPTVEWARVTESRAGTLTYAGIDYVGVELTVNVLVQEAISPAA